MVKVAAEALVSPIPCKYSPPVRPFGVVDLDSHRVCRMVFTPASMLAIDTEHAVHRTAGKSGSDVQVIHDLFIVARRRASRCELCEFLPPLGLESPLQLSRIKFNLDIFLLCI